MTESIYEKLEAYLNKNETTFDFMIGNPKMIVYAGGHCLEEKIPEAENIDLEEIKEDINKMNVAFAIKNAEDIFRKNTIDTEKHEDEIELWKDLNQEKLQIFVTNIIKATDDLQLLRFALLMGNHLEHPTDEILHMYRKLGACAETTYCALPLLRKQPNANEILFQTLKISSGSALLELIEEVNPDNEEKVRWMLRYGRDPFLDWWHTAACVAQKCHVSELLKREDLPQDELCDIAWMISSYFAEGPADGLYERVPDWYEQMETILGLFPQRPQDLVRPIRHMRACISQELERDERLETFMHQCDETLKDPKVLSFFEKEAHEKHRCYSDAITLGIDCSRQIKEDLMTGSLQSIGYAGVLEENDPIFVEILNRISADTEFERIKSLKGFYAYFHNPETSVIRKLLQTAVAHAGRYDLLIEKTLTYGGGYDSLDAAVCIKEAVKKGKSFSPEIMKAASKWDKMLSFYDRAEDNFIKKKM